MAWRTRDIGAVHKVLARTNYVGRDSSVFFGRNYCTGPVQFRWDISYRGATSRIRCARTARGGRRIEQSTAVVALMGGQRQGLGRPGIRPSLTIAQYSRAVSS